MSCRNFRNFRERTMCIRSRKHALSIRPFAVKFSSHERFYELVNQRRSVIRGRFIGSVRRAEHERERDRGARDNTGCS